MCFYPLQKADVLTLVSGYLVERTCRVRQGKSTPHPRWTNKRTQTDGTLLSSTKTWGLLVLAPLLHSFGEKSFFTELGFGLTMQKMTTYSCRNGLVNPSAVHPSLFGENWILSKQFPVSWTKRLIPVSIWELSPSHWAWTGCDGFCTGQELSSKQPILILYLSTPIHLFKWWF